MAKSFLKEYNLIFVGGMNFSFQASKVWGAQALPDPMVEFINRTLVDHHVIDVNVIKCKPT